MLLKPLRRVVAVLGLLCLSFVLLFASFVCLVSLPEGLAKNKHLFDEKITNKILTTEILSRDLSKLLLSKEGQILGARISKDQQWRLPPTNIIPKKYVNALLAFEDRHFYQHPGINPFAIVRASVSNFKAKRIVSGGSTITMQLARMLRQDPPRTYKNKLIELALALKLEWLYSKNEVLAFYASMAPFGGNTVGINAAMWRYFSLNNYAISPREGEIVIRELYSLSWAQAALLAVLPNSPALMHPGRSRKQLKAKRDRLLTALYAQKQISKTELALSILEPIPNKPRPVPQLARHAFQTLISNHDSENVFSSTLRASLQKSVNAIAKEEGKRLQELGVNNLSLIVINHKTMEVEAYIGNNAPTHSRNIYSPAVDIAQQPRSTGSILKPFLYARLLQAGDILPNTLVADVPTSFLGFTPKNYDNQYRGMVPASEALVKSLNIPAVNLLQQYGVEKFQADLKQMGLSTLFRRPEDYGLSLILGGAEGTLFELTEQYALLFQCARDTGAKQLRRAHLLNAHADKTIKRVIDQGSAWLTLDTLLNVSRADSRQGAAKQGYEQKISWKTGTSYGLRDAWAIGSNGTYTVGVWSGNAGGEGVPGLSGLNSAAPALFRVFDALGSSTWLEKPIWSLKQFKTCKADGFLAANNCETSESDAPLVSHFQKTTPYHKRVFLDKAGFARVHGACEGIANMQLKDWFLLPPINAFYWRQNKIDYNQLPPWRADCIASLNDFSNDLPMELIYPSAGAQVYIPVELSGEKGELVMTASHRHKQATLYWHIDDEYKGETKTFHSLAIDIQPGWHKLILVDELGFELTRWFKVLGRAV